jgi:hypothetical protein
MRLLNVAIAGIVATVLLGAADPKTDLLFTGEHSVFPHIAVGGPWSTTIFLVNMGLAHAEFPLRFWTPTGEPWTVSTDGGITAASITVSIPAGGWLELRLPSQGAQIQIGWAQIYNSTDQLIGGHAIFRDSGGPGRPIPFEAIVPLSSNAEGGQLTYQGGRIGIHLPFDLTNGFNTCLAIANPGNVQATLEFIPPSTFVDIASGNQTAFCLRDRIPALDGTKGSLRIWRPQAQLGLSVLGFRFDPQGAFTTFFPMSPP